MRGQGELSYKTIVATLSACFLLAPTKAFPSPSSTSPSESVTPAEDHSRALAEELASWEIELVRRFGDRAVSLPDDPLLRRWLAKTLQALPGRTRTVAISDLTKAFDRSRASMDMQELAQLVGWLHAINEDRLPRRAGLRRNPLSIERLRDLTRDQIRSLVADNPGLAITLPPAIRDHLHPFETPTVGRLKQLLDSPSKWEVLKQIRPSHWLNLLGRAGIARDLWLGAKRSGMHRAEFRDQLDGALAQHADAAWKRLLQPWPSRALTPPQPLAAPDSHLAPAGGLTGGIGAMTAAPPPPLGSRSPVFVTFEPRDPSAGVPIVFQNPLPAGSGITSEELERAAPPIKRRKNQGGVSETMMIELASEPGKQSSCGVTLVGEGNPEWINGTCTRKKVWLTAAHCLTHQPGFASLRNDVTRMSIGNIPVAGVQTLTKGDPNMDSGLIAGYQPCDNAVPVRIATAPAPSGSVVYVDGRAIFGGRVVDNIRGNTYQVVDSRESGGQVYPGDSGGGVFFLDTSGERVLVGTVSGVPMTDPFVPNISIITAKAAMDWARSNLDPARWPQPNPVDEDMAQSVSPSWRTLHTSY